MTLYTRSNKAGASLYAQTTINGKREKYCTETNNKELAKKRAEKHFASLLLGLEAKTSKRSQELNMEQLEAAYPKLAPEIAENTRKDNVQTLKHVLSIVGPAKDIMNAKLWSIYKANKLEGLTNSKKASCLRSLRSSETKIRSIFRKDLRPLYGNLPKPLVDWLDSPKTKAPPVSYEMPPQSLIDKTWEKSKALAKLAPNAHAAFIMAITAGLRAAEIKAFNLNWLNGKRLTVPAFENDFQTKSKRSRVIPVGEAFVKYAKEGITEEDLRVFNRWLKQGECGWTTYKGIHEMRKLYGAQIATGYGLYVAQKLLGHTDPKITSDYYAALCSIPDVEVREQ